MIYSYRAIEIFIIKALTEKCGIIILVFGHVSRTQVGMWFLVGKPLGYCLRLSRNSLFCYFPFLFWTAAIQYNISVLYTTVCHILEWVNVRQLQFLCLLPQQTLHQQFEDNFLDWPKIFNRRWKTTHTHWHTLASNSTTINCHPSIIRHYRNQRNVVDGDG